MYMKTFIKHILMLTNYPMYNSVQSIASPEGKT